MEKKILLLLLLLKLTYLLTSVIDSKPRDECIDFENMCVFFLFVCLNPLYKYLLK